MKTWKDLKILSKLINIVEVFLGIGAVVIFLFARFDLGGESFIEEFNSQISNPYPPFIIFSALWIIFIMLNVFFSSLYTINLKKLGGDFDYLLPLSIQTIVSQVLVILNVFLAFISSPERSYYYLIWLFLIIILGLHVLVMLLEHKKITSKLVVPESYGIFKRKNKGKKTNKKQTS